MGVTSSPVNILAALNYPFASESWFNTLLVATLLLFIPVVGWMMLLGYGLRLINRVTHERPEPPPWDHFNKDFENGLYISIALVLYASPVLIFLVMTAIVGWIGGNEALLILACCISVLLFAYSLFANALFSAALVWFAQTASVVEFFNIPDRMLDMTENLDTVLVLWLNSVLMLLLFSIPALGVGGIVWLLFAAPLVGLCMLVMLILPLGASVAALILSSFHLTAQWGRVVVGKRS